MTNLPLEMTSLPLHEQMHQVTDWLGDVVTRPLTEKDYKRAHTDPTDCKRAFDGFTWGATYMARHSRRNLTKGHIAKGVAQALPVPFLGLAMLTVPISTCFIQRLDQKKARSEQATREDTIAFEFWNARTVAESLARDDQFQVLKNVHGTSRRDVVAWACTCLALTQKVLKDIKFENDRVKNSMLISRQMVKTAKTLNRLSKQYRT